MTEKPIHQIQLTSLGMITSVGLDTLSACASIRAGITRPSSISHWLTVDEDTQEEIPILGHPVSLITDGFTGVGRWLRLSEMAFKDMINFGGLPEPSDVEFWEATRLILVLPHLDGFRFMDVPQCQNNQVPETYQKRLLEGLGLQFLEQNTILIDQGHVGVLKALAELPSLLLPGQIHRVIVLATDSLIDGPSLAWFAQFNRLKAGAKSIGLLPGEASVCLLMEESNAALARAATPLAMLSNTKVLEETEYPSYGRAMSEVIRSCIQSLPKGHNSFSGDFYIDLNGENWRAIEFGAAQSMFLDHVGAYNICIPAEYIGDTGAASGGISVALAARSLQLGYAKTSCSLIVSSGEQGIVAAAALQRME